jgi:esterase/lipase superfamily enzyme
MIFSPPRALGRGFAWAFVALALAGCATTRPLMPTPALYSGPQAKPLFDDPSVGRPSSDLDLLFVTDRAPATDTNDDMPYSANRSRSIAFGSTTVEFGDNVTWDALAKESTSPEATRAVTLHLGATKELGRFPLIPYELLVVHDGITRTPAVIDAHEKARRELQSEIARRLALVPRKEVVLFVHGYHNSFRDAALTMGEICHFLGREFVCGIFTWPAGGSRGLLFGYNVDRESGEFAVEDLVKTIRFIADTPGVQKIHVLAHSRGADLLASALSELGVESYVLGQSLGQRYKLANIVLVAPDIDGDVALSKIFRVFSDPELPFGGHVDPGAILVRSPAFNVSIYVSPDDKALAASSWLFGSIARLGRVDSAMFSVHDIERIRALDAINVIQVRGTTDFFGHGYFISNPEVSSDIVAVLRYGLRPNEPGRPLDEIVKPFWRVRAVDESGTTQ